jgi:hypothetical protein
VICVALMNATFSVAHGLELSPLTTAYAPDEGYPLARAVEGIWIVALTETALAGCPPEVWS